MTKANMPVSIRPLEQDDWPAWRDLWTGYLAFYKTALPDTVFDTTFARLTDPAMADMNALLAIQGDTVIGLVHYIYHRHCWREEDVCYLQDLFVSPTARGTGCGRALIEAVYAAADTANCANVYWLTQDDNHTGRQLYDRVGVATNFMKYQRPAA